MNVNELVAVSNRLPRARATQLFRDDMWIPSLGVDDDGEEASAPRVGRAELHAARAHAGGTALRGHTPRIRGAQLGRDGLGKEQAQADSLLLGARFVLRREGWPNHRRRDFESRAVRAV